MTAGAYVRVSTADQRCELQVRDLREYAERQGWRIAEIYEDVSSGAKASRPSLNRLMADARARKFDCVLVWKLDHFGLLGGLLEQYPVLGRKRHPNSMSVSVSH